MGLLRFTAAALTAAATLGLSVQAAPTIPLSAISKRYVAPRFDFGNTKIRGVNLGGWFVLEPWITPSIFEATPDNVVDEYTFCQVLGTSEAQSRLQNHWSTFYNEEDFALMSQYGLNFVRIPIGYWSITPLAGDPYVQGAYDYLKTAVTWAGNHGLNVMIDLHGAPLSQNGFDNSGKRGSIGWTQGDSISQTHAALNKLRDDFGGNAAVAAIELLNEPLGSSLNLDTIRQFYDDGWGDLQNTPVAITFHDAFEGVTSWNDWGSGLWNLVLDTHHYEVFDSGSLQMGIQDHINTACSFGDQMTSSNKWTISGEWTGAMTDCAKWLNGRGVGARYDGTYNYNGGSSSYIGSCDAKTTGTVAGLGEADHNNIASFIQAQIAAFEKKDGWIFWTWKNEAAPEWHFKNLTEAGMIPQPLSSAASSGICG